MKRRTVLTFTIWLLLLAALAVTGHGDLALFLTPAAVLLGLPIAGRFVGAGHIARRLARIRTWAGRARSGRRPPALRLPLRSAATGGTRCLRGPPVALAAARC